MSKVNVTVLYAQSEDATFDMKYYLSTHMPLVQSHWAKHGLKNWDVLQFPKDAPFSVQATLYFDSMADFQAASGSESAATVFGDVPNFSNKSPTLMVGEVVGSQ